MKIATLVILWVPIHPSRSEAQWLLFFTLVILELPNVQFRTVLL